MFNIYIITGLSGAGKTFANKCMEDMGFYCVDNLPPALIPHFAELCSSSQRKIDRVSLVIDIRGGEFFDDLFKALDALDQADFSYSIIFLDTADEVLIRRYKESRRQHPLAGESGSTVEGIRAERKRLKKLRDRADLYIDTTKMNIWALKKELTAAIAGTEETASLNVTIVSFGFKHGVPLDVDFVFDVRFLPNPHYEEKLKGLTGRDEPVSQFVMASPMTGEFLDKLKDMILFVLPHTIAEGKSNVVISIGCTGGHHRSVVLSIELARFLAHNGYKVNVRHRDIAISD